MSRALKIEGKRFGKLTVLKRVEDYINPKNGNHLSQWLCLCDCGNELVVCGNRLTTGNVKSCGCLRLEHNHELGKHNSILFKQHNTYDLSGEYGIGYTNKGEEFYFDLEDYDKIKDICWLINKDGYVVGADRRFSLKKNMRMHRVVMGVSDPKIFIDHIETKNKNDNRKQNLRIATPQQNNFNRSVSKNNTSGVTGVTWSKSNSKWHAHIKINNKTINLGYYINKNDAIEARKQGEIEYFGEFRYNDKIYKNFPTPKKCFQTNEPVVGTIYLNPNGNAPNKLKMIDGYVITDFNHFGKECYIYKSQNEKLSYLITELFYINNMCADGIEELKQFGDILQAIQAYDNTVKGMKILKGRRPELGYKMIPQNGVSELIKNWNLNVIKDYIFNKNIWLKIDQS